MEINQDQLAALEAKIDALTVSVDKVRNYFKWTLIVSAVLFILPLIGVLFAIPSFINTYTSQLNAIAP